MSGVSASGSATARPKIVYLVTEDWAFRRHRLPMARAARDAGFDVVVVTRISDAVPAIEAEGFRVVPLSWSRRSLNPLSVPRAVWEIRRVLRRERPDLVHNVAVKPVLLGGIAAWSAGVPAVVNALTGLGTLFIGSGSAVTRMIAVLARPVLRFVLSRPGSLTLFQNADDRDLLVRLGLVDPTRSRLIRGSGVDIDHFAHMPEPPAPPVTVAYVGRLIADKGVRELVAAYRGLRERGLDVRLLIAGSPDADNPTSIPPEELEAWRAMDGVEAPGDIDDVRTVWARAHIAVLLSRREGLPKSLLEAAAVGRAMVASDVPGCREIAIDGRDAILVPLDDPAATLAALERLVLEADTRRRFAAESRRMVEADLSASAVGSAIRALYLEAIDRPDTASPMK